MQTFSGAKKASHPRQDSDYIYAVIQSLRQPCLLVKIVVSVAFFSLPFVSKDGVSLRFPPILLEGRRVALFKHERLTETKKFQEGLNQSCIWKRSLYYDKLMTNVWQTWQQAMRFYAARVHWYSTWLVYKDVKISWVLVSQYTRLKWWWSYQVVCCCRQKGSPQIR